MKLCYSRKDHKKQAALRHYCDLNVNALVGTFNQEKALAYSVIVNLQTS